VLDASLALEWFTVGATPESRAKRALLDERVALVPHLWRFEIMNVLSLWQRRKVTSRAQATAILQDLMALPFAVVDEGAPEMIVSLAVSHGLSAYDAAYLQVAILSEQPLATLDRQLLKAAKSVGVECL